MPGARPAARAEPLPPTRGSRHDEERRSGSARGTAVVGRPERRRCDDGREPAGRGGGAGPRGGGGLVTGGRPGELVADRGDVHRDRARSRCCSTWPSRCRPTGSRRCCSARRSRGWSRSCDRSRSRALPAPGGPQPPRDDRLRGLRCAPSRRPSGRRCAGCGRHRYQMNEVGRCLDVLPALGARERAVTAPAGAGRPRHRRRAGAAPRPVPVRLRAPDGEAPSATGAGLPLSR